MLHLLGIRPNPLLIVLAGIGVLMAALVVHSPGLIALGGLGIVWAAVTLAPADAAQPGHDRKRHQANGDERAAAGAGRDAAPPGRPSQVSPWMLASMLPGVLASIVAPAVAYTLMRPHMASSATALLTAMAIPVGWTLAVFAVRRRADPLGLLSMAVMILALTLPTDTFLAVSRPAGLLIIVAGLAVLTWYRRSRLTRTRHDISQPEAA